MDSDSAQRGSAMDPEQATYLEILAYRELARGDITGILQHIQDYRAPEGAAYTPEDLKTDFRAKYLRLQAQSDKLQLDMISQEKETPLSDAALGKLNKQELIKELIDQTIARKAYKTQAKHLFDFVNQVTAEKSELKADKQTLREQNKLLRRELEKAKAAARESTEPDTDHTPHQSREGTREPAPPPAANRQISLAPSTFSGAGGQRSPKHKDPPTLTDGKNPTFLEWESGVKDKLKANADWYTGHTDEQTHIRQVLFLKGTVSGKAFDHLTAYLARRDEAGTIATVDMCREYLQKRFDDPHRRLKARDELNALKLSYLGDFTAFQSEFIRLAQVSGRPEEQWKEDLHDKLYAELRTHMQLDLVTQGISFDTYCAHAQAMARGVEAEGKERKAAAETRRKLRAASPSLKRPTAATPTKPSHTPSAPSKPTDGTTCYNCQGKDHWAKDCPNKKKVAAKAVDLEEEQEEDFSDSDSENGYP